MAAGEPLGLVDAGYRAIDSLSCEKVRTGWREIFQYQYKYYDFFLVIRL